MPEQTTTANPFEGLQIERAEALPKRLVAGREAIPNPFIDAVLDSYREHMDQGPDVAVRSIAVPVDGRGMTFKETKRKGKDGKEQSTGKWQQHSNITTALYLLRQAAIKNDIGVRIVVDYKDGKQDGEHLLDVKQGRVRVRFLGQKKKEQKKETATPAGAETSNAAA